MEHTERSALGDAFDRMHRALEGLPDTINVKPSTVLTTSKVLERTQTFIIETFRQRDEGDTIFLQYIDDRTSLRLAIPPVVSALIARQRDALTDRSRSKAAKSEAARRKAAGIVPTFRKKRS